ncbi:uncharacterized protein LOC109716093 [Ananas comosus]|nr:uncharacterized protein LOC109716093 [Ananas comosus]CAD1832493.1 unnamed protein product [Ananas comosus var. bracteatus]
MESYQPFSPSSKPQPAMAESPKLTLHSLNQKGGTFTDEFSHHPSPMVETPADGFAGHLDVFVHQARDIHNICIYHKQDVYAKICLTSDPADAALSTRIINGGGRNPIFNENLRLGVRTLDSSLKCEVWMLSRVKNYLQDQLLGFALVPLSDIAVADGKLVKEFPLSSTDLYHSPAGFVQLSLSYAGSLPEVMPIPAPSENSRDSENNDLIPCEYEKIQFPDLNVANENQAMISEYFGIPCSDIETPNSESLVTTEDGTYPDDDAGVRVVESFSTENSTDSVGAFRNDTPLSSVSTIESTPVHPTTPQSASEPSAGTSSPSHKDKSTETTDGEADSSNGVTESEVIKPLISINVPEETVVQQEIVDMYMKSMQQFTESLAKMKLPMDIENESSTSDDANSSSEKTLPTPKDKKFSRVFYGSRAFF